MPLDDNYQDTLNWECITPAKREGRKCVLVCTYQISFLYPNYTYPSNSIPLASFPYVDMSPHAYIIDNAPTMVPPLPIHLH